MLSHVLAATILLMPAPLADLAALQKDARSSDSAVRLAAFDALIALGPDGITALKPILRDAEAKAAREFLALANSSAAAGFRGKLKQDIEAARKDALELIHDRKRYPDDAHGAVGQPLVDGAVAKLRELWLHPGQLLREKVPELNAKLYFVKEAAQYLKRAGLEPDTFDSLEDAFAELDQAVGVRDLVVSAAERKKIDEILEWNDTCPASATDEERRFVRILNDYRIMLGLSVLELDDRLVTASRKHSQEMQDLSYFAHESPVEENRTPQMRAAREKFGGGVAENCAVSGGAQDAFDGWYNSSGHHRGMVMAGASQLGGGQSIGSGGAPGRHWTMLIGSADSLRKKGGKPNPRQVYQARVAKLAAGDAETRLRLAKWCLKSAMSDEARKLLEEVVAIEPAHKVAHQLLGHVKSNGRWVTLDEKLAEDLAGAGPDQVLGQVARLLKSDQPAERLAAVRAAKQVGTEGAPPLLVAALKDSASEVRMEACDALAELQARGSAGALKAALGDSSFYVAHAAAAALWRLGNAGGVATLFRGLRSGDLNQRIDSHKRGRAMFGRDFGYAWDLPDEDRAKVVDDWEAWVKTIEPGAP